MGGIDRGGWRPVDGLVIAAVAVPTLADAWWNQPGTRPADGWTYALALTSVAALLLRHRWPVQTAVGCAGALTVLLTLGHRGELLYLPSAVALYTVAAGGARRRGLIGGAVAVVWFGALGWLVGGRASAPATELLWPAVAVLLGEVVRARREMLAEHAAQEARAAADRDRRARQQVQQERLRIAREFHDVVAHTMAAVNVQMAVAAAAFDQRPDTARAALVQARTASRDALHELRAAVTLLRDAADGTSTAPAPGLGQLDELTGVAEAAGVRVTLHRQLDTVPLPAGVELTAFRIVQEALTNVVRHARAGSVAVSVTATQDAVTVEVVDDGRAATGTEAAAAAGSGGHGLLGIGERVAALGGTVAWGPVPAGGFRVHAVLPSAGGPP
jgi:signal transduction histidine kinase